MTDQPAPLPARLEPTSTGGDAPRRYARAGPGRDFVVLGAATLIAQALSFLVLAVMARRLGPEPVGAYAFAVNVAAYFAIPANFGLTALGTRDVARDPSRIREVAGEVLAIQVLLVALPYAAMCALADELAVNGLSASLLPILGLAFVLDAFSFKWILSGTRRFWALAGSRLVGAAS